MANCIYSAASIGGFHTWRDFRSIITNTDVVGSPGPNTTYIEVPGANGHIDLTESLTGDVTYSNRTLKFELAIKTTPAKWPDMVSQIYNSLHGKAVQVILDEKPTHYFCGRVSVDGMERSHIAGAVVLTVDCEPYRYETEETKVTFSGAVECTLENDRMWVCPLIRATGAGAIVYNNSVYNFSKGEQKIADFILKEGSTTFYLMTDYEVTFQYRKGCL